jgi:hypothetical protein
MRTVTDFTVLPKGGQWLFRFHLPMITTGALLGMLLESIGLTFAACLALVVLWQALLAGFLLFRPHRP